MIIQKFNKQNLPSVRTDISKALKDVEEKFGINISLGNISFGSDEFTVKMTVGIGKPGEGLSKMEKDFIDNKDYFGIRFDLNYSFTSQGKTYKVVGLAPRSNKYPVLAQNSKGNVYKFGVGYVNATLND